MFNLNQLIQSKRVKLGSSICMAVLSGVILSGCQYFSTASAYGNDATQGPVKSDTSADRDKSHSTDDMLMCTMQYDPVCAIVEENGKAMYKTFSNDCTVGHYKEGKVISVVKGACQ